MNGRQSPAGCPSWCRDHGRKVHDDTLHEGPLVLVEASYDSDRLDRKHVRVQLEAVGPVFVDDGSDVRVYLDVNADGARLAPSEARAVARALLEAADLAEAVAR